MVRENTPEKILLGFTIILHLLVPVPKIFLSIIKVLTK